MNKINSEEMYKILTCEETKILKLFNFPEIDKKDDDTEDFFKIEKTLFKKWKDIFKVIQNLEQKKVDYLKQRHEV